MPVTMSQWASSPILGPFQIVDSVSNIVNEPLFQLPGGQVLFNLLQSLLGPNSTITAAVQGTTELATLTAGQITDLAGMGTTLIDPGVDSIVPLATGLLLSDAGLGFVDTVVMTVTATAEDLTNLDLTDFQSLGESGVTLVDPVVDSVIPVVTGLLMGENGLSFVDDVVMTVTGTIEEITALDATDLGSLSNIGVTLVDPVVDSVIPIVTGLLMADNGLGFVDDVVMTVTGTIEEITALDATDLGSLADIGVTLVDPLVDGVIPVVTGLLMGENGLSFVDDVVMTVTGTVQELSDLDVTDLESLAGIGVSVLSAGGGILEMTLDQLNAIDTLGMLLEGADVITLVTSVVDIVGLTVEGILDLLGLGVQIIDVTDGPLEITVLQALTFAELGISFKEEDAVIIKDLAINIEAMTAADIEAVAGINVDSINAVNDQLALSIVQLNALATYTITLTGADEVTLADTAAKIGALSTTAIASLGGQGVDAVDATDDVLTLTLGQFNAFVNASIDVAANDVVTIRDAAAALIALTGAQLAALATNGADYLDAIGDIVTLTASQAKAIANSGLAFVDGDNVTLADIGSNILALTAAEFAKLKAAGVDAIDILDGSISLTVAQAVGLATTGLAFAASDIVKLVDTGINIATLTASQIADLKNAGFDLVDAIDNAMSLTAAQAKAFISTGLQLVAADVVTLADTGANIAALTTEELTALKGAGIDALDATNDVLSLAVDRAIAIATVGFTFAVSDVVTIADTAAHIAALTVENIGTLADAGVSKIDATNDMVSLTVAQVGALALGGIAVAAADLVTLADSAANIAAMTTAAIAELAMVGVDQVHSLTNAVEITLDQAQAFAQAEIGFIASDAVGLVDAGADIADLTVEEIAQLVAIGVDYVDAVEDVVGLTLAQAAILANGGLGFAEEDVVTVTATAAELLALTTLEHANLAAAGVDFIDAVENEVVLTIAHAKSLAANGIAHVEGDVVSVLATGAQLSALTADDMDQLVAAGVDILDAIDNQVVLTAAAAKSFIEGELKFDISDIVTIADTGANIATLTAGQLTDLKAAGVDIIDATNNILVLSKLQLNAFMDAGFTFVEGDTVTLTDTGANLAALTLTEIANLDDSNVDQIDSTTNAVTLTMEQVTAFRTAGVAFTAADIVTLSMSSTNFKALAANQIDELKSQLVDRIDLTDNVMSMKAAAWNALGSLGFSDDDTVTVVGTGSKDKLTAHGDGTIILQGGKGADVLKGGADFNVLSGGRGHDKLIGSDGVDHFLFDAAAIKKNSDKISNFDVVNDRILLDNADFKALGASFTKNEFTFGREAQDKSDHIIYDRANGALYYDKDGAGGRDAVKIASFEHGLKLTFSDFDIV
ncbi:hypothetical protein [Rhizobium sp.]